MSENRFIIVKSIYDYYALVDKERKDTKQILLLSLHKEQLDNVADLLNERYSIICRDEKSIETMMSNMEKLENENEQLRKTMNEVIELLVEEVDLFSDKATEHDIIAYKEMNDFDNKDAYYMCISTKKAIKMLQRCL